MRIGSSSPRMYFAFAGLLSTMALLLDGRWVVILLVPVYVWHISWYPQLGMSCGVELHVF